LREAELSRSGRAGLKIAAAVLGVLVTGIPMLMFNAWLKSQGEDEASVTAAWMAAAADRQIGQASALLRDLAARGVDSCTPANVTAMRRAVLTSGAIKEIELLSPAGRLLCTDAGPAFGQRQTDAAMHEPRHDMTLEAVWIGDLGERFVRLKVPSGQAVLGALLPSGVLLPHADLQAGRLLAYARLEMPNGVRIGSSGVEPEADADLHAQRIARVTSPIYGLVVSAAMQKRNLVADYDDLRRIGMAVSGVAALFILGAALLFGWRRNDSPMADVARAIQAEEFVPYYQPVVDIQTGKLLGAEVLARWKQADGTLVQPGAFIPLLESSGLIVDLTRSLMRQVSRDMGAAFGARPNLSIAFNVAPQHFVDALILDDVGSIFNGSSIRLSQVVLELTERYEVGDLAATRRVIAALQGIGCKVAIDDVGAGHSGLSYILKLGVDIIKIDKIFVEAIGTETHSRVIIETMIDLARNMKMEVIAEGVETFEQVTYLRDHGIRSAQGFVFAPPLPGSSLLTLLDAMQPLAAVEAEPDAKAETGRRRRAVRAP
jgi:sensor c-di-GMP phosphodiesterase-like protein